MKCYKVFRLCLDQLMSYSQGWFYGMGREKVATEYSPIYGYIDEQQARKLITLDYSLQYFTPVRAGEIIKEYGYVLVECEGELAESQIPPHRNYAYQFPDTKYFISITPIRVIPW